MAKKSTATRQANAARRSQTTTKGTQVTLVRPAKDTVTADTSSAANGASPAGQSRSTSATATATPQAATTPRAASSSATATKPTKNVVVANPVRPRVPEAPKPARPVVAKTESVSRPAAKAQQSARVARAKATQRARAANLVTPEQYSYVRNDLRLIATLAAVMFAIIIILHFVIPH